MKIIDDIKNTIQRKREIYNEKMDMLDLFMQKDLTKICKDYGLKEPSSKVTNSITGQTYTKEVTRDDYIKTITLKLSPDQIRIFCERNKIRIKK